MGNLRRRKWGCALGITLLIAVPVVLAVWLSQVTRETPAVDNVLQAQPVYPGARDITYTFWPGAQQNYRYDMVAWAEYRADDTARRVLSFYEDEMRRQGWVAPSPQGNSLSLHKFEFYFDGFRFGEPAPWVHPRQKFVPLQANLIAEDHWDNGRNWAKVRLTVNLMPPPAP